MADPQVTLTLSLLKASSSTYSGSLGHWWGALPLHHGYLLGQSHDPRTQIHAKAQGKNSPSACRGQWLDLAGKHSCCRGAGLPLPALPQHKQCPGDKEHKQGQDDHEEECTSASSPDQSGQQQTSLQPCSTNDSPVSTNGARFARPGPGQEQKWLQRQVPPRSATIILLGMVHCKQAPRTLIHSYDQSFPFLVGIS